MVALGSGAKVSSPSIAAVVEDSGACCGVVSGVLPPIALVVEDLGVCCDVASGVLPRASVTLVVVSGDSLELWLSPSMLWYSKNEHSFNLFIKNANGFPIIPKINGASISVGIANAGGINGKRYNIKANTIVI